MQLFFLSTGYPCVNWSSFIYFSGFLSEDSLTLLSGISGLWEAFICVLPASYLVLCWMEAESQMAHLDLTVTRGFRWRYLLTVALLTNKNTCPPLLLRGRKNCAITTFAKAETKLEYSTVGCRRTEGRRSQPGLFLFFTTPANLVLIFRSIFESHS